MDVVLSHCIDCFRRIIPEVPHKQGRLHTQQAQSLQITKYSFHILRPTTFSSSKGLQVMGKLRMYIENLTFYCSYLIYY